MKIKNRDQTQSRKSAIKSILSSMMVTGAALFGLSYPQTAEAKNGKIKRNTDEEASSQNQVPLISQSVTHNGLVYIKGMGYHEEGDITKHTTEVLNTIERELEKAGSSMEKVLKVNVFLADLADYDEMNAAYRGRFGNNPPVRTTVACYSGIPGDSLVEIDCIAAV